MPRDFGNKYVLDFPSESRLKYILPLEWRSCPLLHTVTGLRDRVTFFYLHPNHQVMITCVFCAFPTHFYRLIYARTNIHSWRSHGRGILSDIVSCNIVSRQVCLLPLPAS